MTKTWFRMYVEILNDPKVQRLTPPLFRTWVNLLAVAAQHDGVLPDGPDLAFLLRQDETTTRSHLAALEKAGLIEKPDAGGWTPHNWAARQYESDSSTERVKRFRKRQRNVSGSVSETPPESESDSDSDSDLKDDDDDARARAREGKISKFHLMKEWRPSPEVWARASALGFSESRLELVLSEHIAFCQQGTTPWFDKTQAGWDQCFFERCTQITRNGAAASEPSERPRHRQPRMSARARVQRETEALLEADSAAAKHGAIIDADYHERTQTNGVTAALAAGLRLERPRRP